MILLMDEEVVPPQGNLPLALPEKGNCSFEGNERFTIIFLVICLCWAMLYAEFFGWCCYWSLVVPILCWLGVEDLLGEYGGVEELAFSGVLYGGVELAGCGRMELHCSPLGWEVFCAGRRDFRIFIGKQFVIDSFSFLPSFWVLILKHRRMYLATRYRSILELSTARYWNSVPLGTGTQYRSVTLRNALYHAQYQCSIPLDTEGYRIILSGIEKIFPTFVAVGALPHLQLRYFGLSLEQFLHHLLQDGKFLIELIMDG
ncbi:hypothetical protein MA16_Dca022058 [Dendrobium catenatum]|uniref:Uncharacterized protein n=1 Tax=Dendrobium catenatum TaxID=906689 RepID=A0A2I0X073_9ASPA|nr:hypothetical protein MA16_Dca022058 [Dendrobium catenatum]